MISVDCAEIIYRAFKRSGCFDPTTLLVNANAFILDPKDKDDGLSVYLKSVVPDLGAKLLECFNRSYGAATLHAGRVRTLKLDVLKNPEDPDPAHAVIIGLPLQDDDPELAERLASALRDMSRLVDQTKRKR